jgi:hypothetical protein
MVLAEKDALESKTFYALPQGDTRIKHCRRGLRGDLLSWSARRIEELKDPGLDHVCNRRRDA